VTDVFIMTTSSGRVVKTYHPTDCRTAPEPERRRTITEAEAQNRGLDECNVCSGDDDYGGSSEPWKYHRMAEEIANES